ncbi:uncharacterized protein LOC132637214 [Lycium barbarum]|uniref:uncharacterized protein LOC132637214 n=1 Tax=Lycium barbarum TaxID=112863 RepID=UPI00293ED52C|nr:uncharacterized protein LOC132637214 [Lycium barbarum]
MSPNLFSTTLDHIFIFSFSLFPLSLSSLPLLSLPTHTTSLPLLSLPTPPAHRPTSPDLNPPPPTTASPPLATQGFAPSKASPSRPRYQTRTSLRAALGRCKSITVTPRSPVRHVKMLLMMVQLILRSMKL